MRLIRQIGSILVKAHAEHTESRLSTALSQASRCTYDSARDLSQKHVFRSTGAALVTARSSAARESSGPPVSIRLFALYELNQFTNASLAFAYTEVCCCPGCASSTLPLACMFTASQKCLPLHPSGLLDHFQRQYKAVTSAQRSPAAILVAMCALSCLRSYAASCVLLQVQPERRRLHWTVLLLPAGVAAFLGTWQVGRQQWKAEQVQQREAGLQVCQCSFPDTC